MKIIFACFVFTTYRLGLESFPFPFIPRFMVDISFQNMIPHPPPFNLFKVTTTLNNADRNRTPVVKLYNNNKNWLP